MSTKTNKEPVIADYELRAWISRLESVPVERIEHADFSGCYEMEQMHVYRLENGKYATVHESGCSCYQLDHANIELHPSKNSAMASFNAYCKEQRSYK